MDNKKIIETIEKKLSITVADTLGIVEDGKEVSVSIKADSGTGHKIVLKEMKNQYGLFYKIISDSEFEIEAEKNPKADVNAESASFRTKTERLCGAKRKEIIRFARGIIGSLVDGSAALKEIEGPAKNDTAIRFVLIRNEDGYRFKEDIDIETIKSSIA